MVGQEPAVLAAGGGWRAELLFPFVILPNKSSALSCFNEMEGSNFWHTYPVTRDINFFMQHFRYIMHAGKQMILKWGVYKKVKFNYCKLI